MKTKYTDFTVNEQVISGGRQANYWRKTDKRNTNRQLSGDLQSFNDIVDAQRYMQDILYKFKLKGFEFGNWMEQDSRADNIQACQKSLEQLSKLLGTTNLGIDCNIGVAFGARGTGKALAHYEPTLNMINLTKKKGAGSLAHEYGHALDYNLGGYLDQNKYHTALSGGDSIANTLPDNTGAQLRFIVNKIIDKYKQTQSYQNLTKDDVPEYWMRRNEVFARFFEQYICYKLKAKEIRNLYLTKPWSSYCVSSVYLKEKEFLTLLKDGDILLSYIEQALNDHLTLKATPYPVIEKKAAANTKAVAPKVTKTKQKPARKAAPKPSSAATKRKTTTKSK